MPSFDQLIIAPPLGFATGCSSLNELALEQPEFFQQLVRNCVKHANYHPQNVTEQSHSDAVNVINFIVRSSQQATPAPSVQMLAGVLDSMTFLTRATVEQIVPILQEKGEEDAVKLPSFGQMRNFKWKVGVAVSSNQCKNLYAPYVSVSFDIIQANGQTATHTAEMNFQQFKEFHSSFKQVAVLMDNV